MNDTAKVLSINETVKIENKALALPKKAKLIVVDSNAGLEMADKKVKDLDAMLKEIDSTFKPIADKAFQAHRAVTGKWKEVKQPLEDAKVYLVNQVKAYQTKVKQAIEAEERRLQEIARQEEEERRLLEAEEAEKEGNYEEAQEIINTPVYVAPVKVQNNTPKIDGRKYTVKSKAKVINKLDVIKTVANNPALLDLVDINITVANAKARAFGRELGRVVPGLEYYEE
jgi:predicted phage tail protein